MNDKSERKRRRMPFFDDMDPNAFGTPRGLEGNEEDDFEPVQCINNHWTSNQDLDEEGYCSQCLAEGLIPKEESKIQEEDYYNDCDGEEDCDG